jgi:DNA invertase Pin-like site-specific DNA recombinase
MTRPIDIYVRVSRIGGREQLISPQEQERRARDLARERGLTVGEVLTDLDESGGNLDRPGLQRALRRVESGESGGVIVAWLDRLSRDSEHAHGLVRRITDAGGAIYAPDAPNDWLSPEGQLQAGIVFAFAQYVRQRSRAGFERAKERSIANGVPVHTRSPVGYRKKKDRTLEPDPSTARNVRRAFEMRAAGAGPQEIAAMLEARGVKTSQGSTVWTKQAVYGLLRNRTYLGEVSYGLDRRYVNANAHRPIVDVATWTAAQHPNGRQHQARKQPDSTASLVGLIRCRACGYSMQATRTSRGKRIYRCTVKHAGGVCPAPARVAADAAEACAEAAFFALVDDVKARREPASVDFTPLRRRLAGAQRRLGQAMTDEVQDAAGDGWPAMIANRRRAVERAAAELGAAEAAARSDAPEGEVVSLYGTWENAKPRERRDILSIGFDLFAVDREKNFLVYPRGTAPRDLPSRGYTKEPCLHPIATGGSVPFDDYVRVVERRRAVA